MLNRLTNIFKNTMNDSLKRSMFLSMLCKPFGMIISVLYTPILLGYFGDELYGIWATVLSVINWINYFDIGIGQGMRNILAMHIASNEKEEANKTVSTGYSVLSIISIIVFSIGTLFIIFADISIIFRTSINIKSALFVSFACICINFVLGLSRPMLYATHQAEKVSIMTVIIQLLNFVGVLILSKYSKSRLLGVACITGITGIFVNICYSNRLWRRFDYLKPKYSNFERKELRAICNFGVKIFFIQVSALILYTTDNMIITQLFGPSYVTPYHTSYTAFGIVNGMFSAMLSPMWSKYTVAMQEQNYKWIKKTILGLDKALPLVASVLLIGVFVFKPVSQIWLHKNLTYETGLIPCMAIYFFLQIWGSIYATVLNGTGKVNLQLILGVSTAIFNIPLSIILGNDCRLGTTGVLLATVICMLITNIPVTLYTHRFLNKEIKRIESGL